MPKFVHIVYIHPVENGWANLYKVVAEREFDIQSRAEKWAKTFNEFTPEAEKAVYYGCVNDETGELV